MGTHEATDATAAAGAPPAEVVADLTLNEVGAAAGAAALNETTATRGRKPKTQPSPYHDDLVIPEEISWVGDPGEESAEPIPVVVSDRRQVTTSTGTSSLTPTEVYALNGLVRSGGRWVQPARLRRWDSTQPPPQSSFSVAVIGLATKLKRLCESDVVESRGAGPSREYRLRPIHFLDERPDEQKGRGEGSGSGAPPDAGRLPHETLESHHSLAIAKLVEELREDLGVTARLSARLAPGRPEMRRGLTPAELFRMMSKQYRPLTAKELADRLLVIGTTPLAGPASTHDRRIQLVVAYQEVVMTHMGIVVDVAAKIGVVDPELLLEGRLALSEAVRTYSERSDKGADFAQYAYERVEAAVRFYMALHIHQARHPNADARAWWRRIIIAREVFIKAHHRRPTIAEWTVTYNNRAPIEGAIEPATLRSWLAQI